MELLITQLVQAANAASRPVASTLHLCLCLTYAAHLYRHRHDWARGHRSSRLRSLFFFPLCGGHRHAVFQIFAWGLWTLSAGITLPVYLSLLAADSRGVGAGASAPSPAGSAAAVFVRTLLLRILGLRKPLIPLTHVDAASGAAAVSGLWGELFMLKALLVFEGGARLSRSSRARGSAGSRGSRARRRHSSSSADDAAAADAERALLQRERQLSRSSSEKRHLQRQQEDDGCQTEEQRFSERGGGTRPHADGGGDDYQCGEAEQHRRAQLVEGPLASLLVVLMGLALSVTGCVLLLALEHLPDTGSGVLYCCLALSCVFIGASSTHGLGGHLRHCAGAAGSAGAAVLRASAGGASAASAAVAAMHGGGGGGGGGGAGGAAAAAAAGVGGVGSPDGDGEEADVAPTWRFFQPFQGGSVFVATQAIGWTLFSSTVVAVLLLVKGLVAGVGYCLRCWALAAGALMMATQLVLGVSILTFQTRRTARKLLQPVLHHPRASLARAAGLVMPVVLMYLPLHVSCSAIAATFALLPPAHAATAVAAVLLPYFVITLRSHPAHSGCRRWGWLCRWFSSSVEGSLAWWAGRLEVIWDFGTEFGSGPATGVQGGPGPGLTVYSGTGSGPGSSLGGGRIPGYPTAHDVANALEAAGAAAAAVSKTAAATAAGATGRKRKEGGNGHGADGGAETPRPCSQGRRGHQCSAPEPSPEPSPERRYVLGFHPHGLYPTGAGFLPLMPSVQSAFPRTSTIVTLTASIVHYLPGLRDIAGWAGFRQVTRATFRRALRDTGAVLLCPGGQAELVYADRALPPRASTAAAVTGTAPAPMAPMAAPTPKAAAAPLLAAVGAASTEGCNCAAMQAEAAMATAVPLPVGRSPAARPRPHQLVIYAGHQGFVRLALEEGAWLVPVLALGEVLQLRNLISAPEMQRVTYKRLGFPVPFILAGRWGLTTLPLRNPLLYVIGAPLPPPTGWPDERRRQLAEREDEGASGAGAERPRLRRRQRPPPLPAAATAAAAAAASAAAASAAACGTVSVPQGVVDGYHVAFYAALAVLWGRHRHRHPVLRGAELVMEWGKGGQPAGWETALRAAEAAYGGGTGEDGKPAGKGEEGAAEEVGAADAMEVVVGAMEGCAVGEAAVGEAAVGEAAVGEAAVGQAAVEEAAGEMEDEAHRPGGAAVPPAAQRWQYAGPSDNGDDDDGSSRTRQ